MAVIYNTNRIVTDGLVLHLDAGNTKSYSGSGTTWNDLSGNGRNFTWNATPSFTSSGANSYFSTSGFRCTGPASNSLGITDSTGYTIFLVSLQNTVAQSAAFKFYGSGSQGRGIAVHCAWSDGNIYFDQGGQSTAATRIAVASGGTTTWNIWTFRRSADSLSRTVSKNGTTIATNTTTAANLNLISTAIDVGRSDEFGWDARLNAFYVYNRGLTDAEITQNFKATRGRFGL